MNPLTPVLLTVLILLLGAVFSKWYYSRDNAARRAADYTYREMADNLTPEERALDVAEERANHARRTSLKDVIW